MAIPRRLLLILTLHLITTTTITTTIAASSFDLNWPINNIQSTCRGSIAECLSDSDDDEFMLDSEINRRVLAVTRYISYAALEKNSAPCSYRGASYYNCRPGASGNPYTRGCSAITRCRGG